MGYERGSNANLSLEVDLYQLKVLERNVGLYQQHVLAATDTEQKTAGSFQPTLLLRPAKGLREENNFLVQLAN